MDALSAVHPARRIGFMKGAQPRSKAGVIHFNRA
jgi:hypothetical protein